MKVTSLDLYSGIIGCNFSFRDPALQDQYLVKGVTGLDAESIVPKAYGRSVQFNYNQFVKMQPDPRVITLRLGLNPNFAEFFIDLPQSFSVLRDYMYRAISSYHTGIVQLFFNDGDEAVGYIEGRVTKFEASHATAEPEIQLTITCDDPFIRAPFPTNLETSDIAEGGGAWTGTRAIAITDSISTAPHGCAITFVPTAPFGTLEILSNDPSTNSSGGPDWFFRVSPGNIGGNVGFLVSDSITVTANPGTAEPGMYNVKLHRGGHDYKIVDKVHQGSVWPIVFFGSNNWAVTADTEIVYFSFSHTYWGI